MGRGGSLSKFGPLDKDDAVPMVRKVEARESEGGPVGTTYNGPMSLTRTDVKRGPNSHRPPPAGTPASRLIGFPVWARRSVGRVQSLCDGCRGELLKFRIVLNFVLGALAHLQLGRAYAASGDVGKARVAYQDFFALWKDADPDIPILKEAKAEYAKLQ
jgi:hypothetical protein